jgi:hypothetical protein
MARIVTPRSGWQRGERYDYLASVERSIFAWEWLRRTPDYRRAWAQSRGELIAGQTRLAARFGLLKLIAPSLSGAEARPIWAETVDPRVLHAVPGEAIAQADRINLWQLRRWAAAIVIDDLEHWRFGDQRFSIRIDLRCGTLLGGEAALAFRLDGLARLAPKVAALDLLVRLAGRPDAPPAVPAERRAARWIAELRVADALAAGARQQEMARVLLGPAVLRDGWREAGEIHRLRIQRLVRSARAHLAAPLARLWFGRNVR